MADDLIRRKLLDGMDRVDVEKLLGPSLANLSESGIDSSKWHNGYHLGLERGPFALDDEFLVIRFNTQGRVAEYRIVTN